MSEVFKLADSYIEEQAKLDPIGATFEGIAGHDAEMTDYSPEGYAQRVELARRYRGLIESCESQSHRDFVTRDVIIERLSLDIDAYEHNDHLRELAFSWSSAQAIRSVFDQMRYESQDDWTRACERLTKVPDALKAVQQTLQTGLDNGVVAAQRQAVACARQARVWAGTDVEGRSFFRSILDQHADAKLKGKLADKLERAADQAAAALDEYSNYLVDVYAPKAGSIDAVGHDRYVRAADGYLGMRIDPQETYDWGWEELARLKAEINDVCSQIKPAAELPEIIKILNDDHERWIRGEAEVVEWLKGLLERATTRLDGTVFDIPAPLKRLDVRIAPPGGPANQYYVPPSEDLSRPGTYWYPTDGKTRFPIWSEISTAYHEGVPGHHLQCGIVKVLSDELSRFQRNLFISGHGEGWALYAERLMDEVGFYERPEYKLDMLLSHYFRAARVVVDIGLHLGLAIPAAHPFHSGETWTPELAHQSMLDHSNLTDSFIASEIVRYLGIPAQAISYKVGERVWLDARATAKQNLGSEFDLRTWHNYVLALGPMGLQQLKTLAVGPS